MDHQTIPSDRGRQQQRQRIDILPCYSITLRDAIPEEESFLQAVAEVEPQSPPSSQPQQQQPQHASIPPSAPQSPMEEAPYYCSYSSYYRGCYACYINHQHLQQQQQQHEQEEALPQQPTAQLGPLEEFVIGCASGILGAVLSFLQLPGFLAWFLYVVLFPLLLLEIWETWVLFSHAQAAKGFIGDAKRHRIPAAILWRTVGRKRLARHLYGQGVILGQAALDLHHPSVGIFQDEHYNFQLMGVFYTILWIGWAYLGQVTQGMAPEDKLEVRIKSNQLQRKEATKQKRLAAKQRRRKALLKGSASASSSSSLSLSSSFSSSSSIATLRKSNSNQSRKSKSNTAIVTKKNKPSLARQSSSSTLSLASMPSLKSMCSFGSTQSAPARMAAQAPTAGRGRSSSSTTLARVSRPGSSGNLFGQAKAKKTPNRSRSRSNDTMRKLRQLA